MYISVYMYVYCQLCINIHDTSYHCPACFIAMIWYGHIMVDGPQPGPKPKDDEDDVVGGADGMLDGIGG